MQRKVVQPSRPCRRLGLSCSRRPYGERRLPTVRTRDADGVGSEPHLAEPVDHVLLAVSILADHGEFHRH